MIVHGFAKAGAATDWKRFSDKNCHSISLFNLPTGIILSLSENKFEKLVSILSIVLHIF